MHLPPAESGGQAKHRVRDGRRRGLFKNRLLRRCDPQAQIDQNIGKLVAALEVFGELNDALVSFSSDNDGCPDGGMLGRRSLEGPMIHDGYSHPRRWPGATPTPHPYPNTPD